MRNPQDKRNLNERRGVAGTVLALTLSASLAAFGCTTNRTPGDGEPTRTSPAVAPAALPGSSGGTSDGTQIQPMFSSSGTQLTPDQAAALMAQHQTPRVRVLGSVDPGPSPTGNNPAPNGQFSWPALQTNPQVTVNSSISSAATPAVISGAGEGVGGSDAGVTAAGNALASAATNFGSATTVTSSATAASPTSAAVFSNTASAATPTTAALPASAGAFAAGPSTVNGTVSPIASQSGTALSPTVSSGAATTPTASLNSAAIQPDARLGTPTGSSTTTRTGTTPGTTTGAATGNGTVSASRLSRLRSALGLRPAAASNGNVRVTTDASGAIVVTNDKPAASGKPPQK